MVQCKRVRLVTNEWTLVLLHPSLVLAELEE